MVHQHPVVSSSSPLHGQRRRHRRRGVVTLAGPPRIQDGSPLYAKLPPELRFEIFETVFESTFDMSKAYPFNSYYARPGYIAPKKTDLDVLLTCRMVYLEAKDLVWKESSGNTELAFWWGTKDRSPPQCFEPKRNWKCRKKASDADIRAENQNHPYQSLRTKALKPHQWSKITTIHIFSHISACDAVTFARFFRQCPSLQPHTVKLTIRYTDWWWWEIDSDLDVTQLHPNPVLPDFKDPGKWDDIFSDQWKSLFHLPRSCRALFLELETIESKKDQLSVQVERILSDPNPWRWKLQGGKWLEADRAGTVEEREWMGPTTFGEEGKGYRHHPEGNTMKYVSKTLVFRPPVQ
ncbi:hypothetical protein CC2G_001742 [Coprinopsis cinerea AmutBmut pab1-1]|nr:hypothetical protein CC2G_001742 [Coprinopsis cinerea AmutBmut pab1-1]